MKLMKHIILAAGLIGGAVALSGANHASAAILAPAFAQASETAAVQDVRHTWEHRPGRLQGERYWQRKNAPHHYSYGFRRSGPSIGFGLSVPGFGLSVGEPAYDGRWHGYQLNGYRDRYGRISR